MSRSAFLGTGAAAGASLYFSRGVHAAPVPRSSVNRTVDCAANLANNDQWKLPASHLETLWTDLMPRAVAAMWLGLLPFPLFCEDLTDTIKDEWINNFFLFGSGMGSDLFKARLTSLHAFLSAGEGPPIRLQAEGEYDFAISNEGLDLYAPPRLPLIPQPAQKELLKLYSLRRTGRATLGVAGLSLYGTTDHLGYNAQSSTGPAQLTHVHPCVLPPTGCDATPSDALRPCGVAAGSRAQARRILGIREIDPRDNSIPGVDVRILPARELEPDHQLALLENLLVTGLHMSEEDFANLRSFAADPERTLSTIDNWIDEHTPENCVPLPPGALPCLTATTRCWQVTGQVLGGLLEQYPREVALRWHDTPAIDFSFTGLRENMKQRLETSLPGDTEMMFGPDPVGSTLVDTAADGVTITNRGIFFPEPGKPDDAVVILNEIMHGRAGNPVFTDSRQSI